MIKKKIQTEVNDQIQAEFQSGWLYLAMAGWFEQKNLDGFAHWMKQQWQEEQEHGMKFYHHLMQRGGEVEIKALDKPKVEAKNVSDVFESVLEHEKYITKRIHKLYDLAKKENDYPLQILLQWFIDEQVEEEETASNILGKVKMVGEEGSNLYIIDRELAQRDL